jgi:hypothetical protein
LLHDVHHLVVQQVSSRRTTRFKFSRVKDDMMANRVGSGIDGSSGLRGLRIGVNPHARKIKVCACSYVSPDVSVERLARILQHVANDWRSCIP